MNSLETGGRRIVESSLVEEQGVSFFLVPGDEGGERMLGVRGETAGFHGTRHEPTGTLLCPLDANNAEALRGRLPWLRPVPLGLRTSAGFGDRLGLATPGHVRALRRVCGSTDAIAGIFAQQSVRENARTGRTPQKVLDDATWGLFETGWRSSWGADADHLKTTADVEAFVAAGYTFFTIDPGDKVNDAAQAADSSELESSVRTLPWEELEDSFRDMESRYLDRPVDLGDEAEILDRGQIWRAAAKYGKAVAHAAAMYRHLAGRLGDRNFELEVSVDETANPTTVAEHIFIATELSRLGVRWVSLAPRFVGGFEKGVDYIGDLEVFTSEFARHAAVARRFGPYKLSLHSGSDKFSIYPIAARLTAGGAPDGGGPLVHVKTAGTSYLEALRAVAKIDPDLFRMVLALARERYEVDRATYHVSAVLNRVPVPEDLSDADLPFLLDAFDAREVLHVTFGSVLDVYGDRLHEGLRRHEDVYSEDLVAHFERHLKPFMG